MHSIISSVILSMRALYHIPGGLLVGAAEIRLSPLDAVIARLGSALATRGRLAAIVRPLMPLARVCAFPVVA